MKLLLCLSCGDVVRMRPEARACWCGASSGRYLDDEIVEQTDGALSIALHNHDLRAAIDAFGASPDAWHPLMVFRAYLNPRSEPDVRYVAAHRTCARCGDAYRDTDNADDACRYHPGRLRDRDSLGQDGAGAAGDFYDCCQAQLPGDGTSPPGCARGRHEAQPPASGASR